MSAVAVQTPPVGFHPTFRQNRHSAAPPAALVKPPQQPGIITLSKPLNTRQSPRQRKASPVTQQPATPKSEKSRKPRSRPSSDEEEHDTPSKPRGRRPNAEKTSPVASPSGPKRRNPSRTRQSPSPESEPTPQLQKPSGRLARQRKGTKSTPSLCAALNTPGSAPVPVPQLSNSASHGSGLSRSAPMATSMPQSMPARMRRTLTGNGRDDQKEAPPSPSPRRVRESPKVPHTAPLGGGFPPRPAHARSTSDALFNLSLDEPDDEPQEMPVLFRNRSADKVYAGGRFQNGPDTTTLPAPSFLTGF